MELCKDVYGFLLDEICHKGNLFSRYAKKQLPKSVLFGMRVAISVKNYYFCLENITTRAKMNILTDKSFVVAAAFSGGMRVVMDMRMCR